MSSSSSSSSSAKEETRQEDRSGEAAKPGLTVEDVLYLLDQDGEGGLCFSEMHQAEREKQMRWSSSATKSEDSRSANNS